MVELVSAHEAEEVIKDGHPPAAKDVVLVDYDSTLFPFGSLFDSEQPPFPGVPEAMRRLRDAGKHIVIFTSRLSRSWHRSEGWDPDKARYENTKYIARNLAKWNIPFNFITDEKMPAEVMFDDKAVRVTPEYPLTAAINDFLGFKPLTYGFPASYGYGKRWHVAHEKTVLSSYPPYLSATRTVALCQKDSYYSLGLDRFTESHVAPEPFCKHCKRLLDKETARAA